MAFGLFMMAYLCAGNLLFALLEESFSSFMKVINSFIFGKFGMKWAVMTFSRRPSHSMLAPWEFTVTILFSLTVQEFPICCILWAGASSAFSFSWAFLCQSWRTPMPLLWKKACLATIKNLSITCGIDLTNCGTVSLSCKTTWKTHGTKK